MTLDIPEQYLAAIQQTYPRLSLDHLQINHDGMNNDVVVINQTLVCRFQKTDAARRAIANEIAVLNLLQGRMRVRIPAFEEITDTFVSYRYIAGAPLSRNMLLRMQNPDRSQVMGQLRDFFSDLHHVSESETNAGNVQESAAQRTTEQMLVFYSKVQEQLYSRLWRHQRRWIDELFEPLVSEKLQLNTSISLIHGDLSSYHILYDSDISTINGVIDFGTAGVGSQAVDLACLIDTYGESLARQIIPRDTYTANTIDEARFRAGVLWLEWALIGLEHGDTDMLMAHIGHSARDLMPHGSTW